MTVPVTSEGALVGECPVHVRYPFVSNSFVGEQHAGVISTYVKEQ